jgi:hypothetical protein
MLDTTCRPGTEEQLETYGDSNPDAAFESNDLSDSDVRVRH